MSPVGSKSATRTLLAVLGPWLVRVNVKLMTSPTLGVARFTLLVKARSACCGVSVTLALLFVVTGSNWSALVIAALLVCGLGMATIALSVSVAWPRLARLLM